MKANTVSDLWYTPADTDATGLLNVRHRQDQCRRATSSVDTEVRIDGVVTANVQGQSTTSVRPHGVHVDLRSGAKPAAQTVLGTKLDWKIKVDGSTRLHTKQGFSAHAAYYENFKTGSGRHVIRIYRNDHLVRTSSSASDPHQHTQRAPAHFGPGLLPVRRGVRRTRPG